MHKLGQQKEALSLVTKNTQLDEDLSGWGIQQKLLQIILTINLHKIELAENLLQNLNRRLNQFPSSIISNTRIQIIVSVFNSMQKNGFNSAPTKEIISKLNELAGKNRATSWTPMEAELLPLHEEIARLLQIKLSSQSSKSLKTQ